MTREIFLLKNHTQIEMEKLIPDPLINKKSKIATPLDQQSNTSSLFLLYVQVEAYQNVLKQRC